MHPLAGSCCKIRVHLSKLPHAPAPTCLKLIQRVSTRRQDLLHVLPQSSGHMVSYDVISRTTRAGDISSQISSCRHHDATMIWHGWMRVGGAAACIVALVEARPWLHTPLFVSFTRSPPSHMSTAVTPCRTHCSAHRPWSQLIVA